MHIGLLNKMSYLMLYIYIYIYHDLMMGNIDEVTDKVLKTLKDMDKDIA